MMSRTRVKIPMINLRTSLPLPVNLFIPATPDHLLDHCRQNHKGGLSAAVREPYACYEEGAAGLGLTPDNRAENLVTVLANPNQTTRTQVASH